MISCAHLCFGHVMLDLVVHYHVTCDALINKISGKILYIHLTQNIYTNYKICTVDPTHYAVFNVE